MSHQHHRLSSSHIALDLSHRQLSTALTTLQTMKRRMTHIKSAHVFAHRSIHKKLNSAEIMKIFETLGSMPNLRYLRVELNYHFNLPVPALTTILKAGRRIKSLQLTKLTLDGSISQVEALEILVKKHHCLHNLEINHCDGTNGALMKIAMNIRVLKGIRIVATPFMSPILAELAFSKDLQKLSLEELPDITDYQVASLALGLSSGHCQVRELCIRSSMLSDATGEAITDMLLVNLSIESLTLHIDWERCGSSMARCFKFNTVLKEVNLRCYGDDEIVMGTIKQIARALFPREADFGTKQVAQSSLKCLRLSLEVEPEEYYAEIIYSFEKLLDHNKVIQDLKFDDGVQEFPLPESLQNKLKLNACGFSRYIFQSTNGHSTTEIIEGIISQKDNLEVTFHVLRNCPELICQSIGTVAAVRGTVDASTLQKETKQPLKTPTTSEYWFFRHPKSRQPRYLTPTKTQPRPSLKRKVLCMLSPAA